MIANYKQLHCKKRFVIFPFPAGMSLTKLCLGGNNDVIYKLFPPRESLVSDIPAGDGKIVNLFFTVCLAQSSYNAHFSSSCLPLCSYDTMFLAFWEVNHCHISCSGSWSVSISNVSYKSRADVALQKSKEASRNVRFIEKFLFSW